MKLRAGTYEVSLNVSFPSLGKGTKVFLPETASFLKDRKSSLDLG